MASSEPSAATPSRLRSLLLAFKYVGLALTLGGMASLTAMSLLGPRPTDVAGWHLIAGIMRSIFFPVFFAGLILVVLAGLALYLRSPRHWHASMWFRAKVVMLAVALPSLHLFARGRVLDFYDAIDTTDLVAIHAHWDRVGVAFMTGFVVLVALAGWARLGRPRDASLQ